MAKVPYAPVPEVAPTQGGPGGISVDTPLAAFGGATATSLGNLGAQLERTGDELFMRASAMQQVYNESEAREADTQYMMEAGELHAKFKVLQGKDAVAAQPKFFADLKEARERIGATLSNPHSRRLYDSQTMGTMGRTIFNGADHAASQNRQFYLGSLESRIKVTEQSVVTSPDDEVGFQAKIKKATDDIHEYAIGKGWGENSPQEQALRQQTISTMHANRIKAKSETEPFTALEQLEKAAQSGKMVEADVNRLRETIGSRARSIESLNIASLVYTAGIDEDGNQGKTLVQLEEDARARARKMAPNDPVLEKNSVTAVQGLWNQRKTAERTEVLEARQTVAAAIRSGVKNTQELLATPRYAAAYDRLPETEKNQVPGQINRFNAARDLTDNNENFNRLRALSTNDVEAFLNIDMTQQKLSQHQIVALQNLQEQRKKKASEDPRVFRYMNIMKGSFGAQMEALGVHHRTERNKDDYDLFQGRVSAALDEYFEINKKPPDGRVFLETIAPEILKSYTRPRRVFGVDLPVTISEPRFKQAVPEDFADVVRKGAAALGREAPDVHYIQRQWQREQFRRFYSNQQPKP